MPIDYSKWDKLEVSSSSEDEADAPRPRVTRLDTPSRVTFGGKSVSASSKAAAVVADPSEIPPPSTKPPKSTPANNFPSFWTDHGGLAKLKDGEPSLYWAQDRYTVTLRLELSKGEKTKSVVVEGILPYADRWSAVGSTKPTLVCRSSETVLLEGELPHPVHFAEEDSDVDWCVEDRILVVTLNKAGKQL